MPYEFVPRSVDPRGWVYVPDQLGAIGSVSYAGQVDHPGPPQQDDLTALDGLVSGSEKLGPDDEDLPQPPQDPGWRPDEDEA